MISPLFRIAVLVAGLAGATPALAASITDYQAASGDVISDSIVDVDLFGGDVFIGSYAPALSGPGGTPAVAPAYAEIAGGFGFDPLYTLVVEDAASNALLLGDILDYRTASAGVLEFLFQTTADATGLFGETLYVTLTVDPSVTDGFGPGADYWGIGTLVVATAEPAPAPAVPLPASAVLLLAGLAGFGIKATRRR